MAQLLCDFRLMVIVDTILQLSIKINNLEEKKQKLIWVMLVKAVNLVESRMPV